MGRTEGKLGLLTNFFIKHSVAIFVITTAICLILISYLTNTLKPNVIGIWLVVGILTSLLFSGVALVVVLAVAAVDKARHLRVITYEDKTGTNLRDHFEQEKLKVEDFYSPLFLVNANKNFVQCELRGPGSMFFQESDLFESCQFHLCDLVIVQEGDKANTAAYFKGSTFRHCRFVNIVLYMPQLVAKRWLETQSGRDNGEIFVVGRPAK
jgi:hypothetical protein